MTPDTVLAEFERLVPAGKPERREATFDNIEVREEGDTLRFEGHAAVFESRSEDLGGFREEIQRGAFRKVLDSRSDVKFLHNHNPDHVLASTGAGTMELREDPKGLHVRAEFAPTTLGKDLSILIRRGDVSKMSFGFNVGKEGRQQFRRENGVIVRTIQSFARVMDVGTCTFPAYWGTGAAMRSLVCGIEIVNDGGEVQEEILREIAWKIHRGELTVTDEERTAVDSAFAKTTTVSPWMTQRALMAASQEPELQGVILGKRATVVFEDAPSGTPVMFRLAARKRRLPRPSTGAQTEQRGDAAVVHLLRTMIGLAGQYVASDEKNEGDDDVARMKNVLSTLNALLADELEEPS